MARRRSPDSQPTVRPDPDVIPASLLPWGLDGERVPVAVARARSAALDAWLSAWGYSTAADRDSRRTRAALIEESRRAHALPEPTDPRARMYQETA